MLQRWRGRVNFAGGRQIRKQAVAPRGNREDHKDAVLVPINRRLAVGNGIAAHVHVRQHPVAVHRVARKDRTNCMPHQTVGAVASCEPVRRGRFFATVGIAKHGVDTVGAEADTCHFNAALDADAQLIKALL